MTAGLFTAITFLAVFTEFIAERLFGSWLHGKWMWLLASAIGIALAFAFSLDITTLVEGLGHNGASTIAGKAITGCIIGAGSNVAHDFLTKYIPRK